MVSRFISPLYSRCPWRLMLLLAILVLSASGAWARSFPVPSDIQPNVDFWIRVYATYPTTKGVIHDNKDLAIVYEVIQLVSQKKKGHRRINRKRIKKMKAKYRRILDHLAAGKKAVTNDQKRVAAMFGPKAGKRQYKRAKERIRFQLGQRDRFIPGVRRSGQYLERIKNIFRSHGLPEDLAYLPHVESSYNHKAYSKFGAAGMWQFIRSTGRRFMKVDYVVDERRDPIASSHAAAKFLKENYQTLGNWPLAITAYNHGAGGMARAKRQKGSYARIFREYNGPRFRFASRNFYPSFIAARHVAKNYQRYFGQLRLDRPIQYHVVKMKGYAPIAEVTKFFHISAKKLRAVNPALRPPVFDGQKYIPRGYKLRLPGKRSKMALLSSAMPTSLFRAKQKRSRFYRVQRGDTAGKIARRNGVSLADLKIANGLNRRAKIYVGQNLRIPGVGEQPTMLAVARDSKSSRQDNSSLAAIKKNVLTKGKKSRFVSTSTSTPAPPAPLAALVGGSKWQQKTNPHGLQPAKDEVIALAVAKVEKKVEKKVAEPQSPVVAAPSPAITTAVEPEPPTPVVIAAIPPPAPEQPQVVEAADLEPVQETEVKELVPSVASQPQPEESLADEQGPPSQVTAPEPKAEAALLASHEQSDAKSTAATVEKMMAALGLTSAELEKAIAEPVATPPDAKKSDVVEEEVDTAPAVEKEGAAPPTTNPQVQVVTGNFSVVDVRPYKKGKRGTIQVEAEETLGHYADWLEIPTRKIRRLNNLRFGRPIHYGQKLRLPFAKISKEEFEERRFLYHQELMEDFFQAFVVTDQQDYQIKQGDNLWTICHETFDLPFWLLKQYNADFDFQKLRLGAVIKVPMVAKGGDQQGLTLDDSNPDSDKENLQ